MFANLFGNRAANKAKNYGSNRNLFKLAKEPTVQASTLTSQLATEMLLLTMGRARSKLNYQANLSKSTSFGICT